MNDTMNDTMKNQRTRLLTLLRELSYEEREVVLASGQKSDYYIDARQTCLHAEGHFLVGQLIRATIARVAPMAEAVGGMTLGADPITSSVAFASFLAGHPLHGFLIRKEPKGHGTGQWVEGGRNLRSGMKAVLVEDTVTTGGSVIRAIERAKTAELDVIHVVGLVDRECGGRAAIEEHAPFTTLFTVRDLRA